MKEQRQAVVENRRRVYDFLAQLFLNPIPTPGSEYVKRFCDAIGDFSDYSELEDYRQGVRLLKNFKAVANCGNSKVIQKQLAIDRTRLCRGTAKKDEITPPYEALYLKPEKEMDQLLLLTQFYKKAGLKVSDDNHDRIDYIGVELAFMAELCTIEGATLEMDQKNEYETILILEQEFLNEHLLKWVMNYCGQMISLAQTEFFRGFGYLIRAFLQEEKELYEQ